MAKVFSLFFMFTVSFCIQAQDRAINESCQIQLLDDGAQTETRELIKENQNYLPLPAGHSRLRFR